ncbi:PIN domain-containing protein [Streptomyces lavendulocolor]|uniref:PIN domain-containing protein n=1 Tax=Streptomyces lavendulocolor TaxID=67316 RepID=UPI0033E88331
MIVLDANQLRQVLPGKPALKLLKAAAQRSGHTLATTDIVIREVTRQRREELTTAIAQLTKAQRTFNNVASPDNQLAGGPFDKLTKEFIEAELKRFKSGLQAFHILETTPEDAREALLREADHTAPCLTGVEGRDASIWLTALRASRSPELTPGEEALPTIFVSEDATFCGADDQIASSLLKDVPDGTEVLLQRTVIAVMGTLGFPIQWNDVSTITDSPEFHEALVAAVAIAGGPILLGHLDTETMTPPRLASPRGQQCHGEDTTLTSVRGEWTFQVLLGESSSDPAGNRKPGYTVQVGGEALVTQDRSGSITDVAFSTHVIRTAAL